MPVNTKRVLLAALLSGIASGVTAALTSGWAEYRIQWIPGIYFGIAVAITNTESKYRIAAYSVVSSLIYRLAVEVAVRSGNLGSSQSDPFLGGLLAGTVGALFLGLALKLLSNKQLNFANETRTALLGAIAGAAFFTLPNQIGINNSFIALPFSFSLWQIAVAWSLTDSMQKSENSKDPGRSDKSDSVVHNHPSNEFPNKPWHQDLIESYIPWIVAGITVVGSAIDTVNNIGLITPTITWVVTFVVLLAVGGSHLYFANKPIPWITKNGQTVHLIAIGKGPRLIAVGVLIALWAPRVADYFDMPLQITRTNETPTTLPISALGPTSTPKPCVNQSLPAPASIPGSGPLSIVQTPLGVCGDVVQVASYLGGNAVLAIQEAALQSNSENLQVVFRGKGLEMAKMLSTLTKIAIAQSGSQNMVFELDPLTSKITGLRVVDDITISAETCMIIVGAEREADSLATPYLQFALIELRMQKIGQTWYVIDVPTMTAPNSC